MTRIFCFLAVFFAAGVAKSQDLADRIPADAIGVVKINTPRFFESVSVDDFSRSSMGEMLVRFLDNDERHASIADYGIALDRAGYMYAINSDSVRYTVFLWPVSDAAKLERALFADKEVEAIASYKRHINKPEYYGQTTVYTWNEAVLTVVSPNQVPGYFDKEEVAERYGLANKDYYDFYEEYEENAMSIEGEPYETADYWDGAYLAADSIETVLDSVAVERCADSVIRIEAMPPMAWGTDESAGSVTHMEGPPVYPWESDTLGSDGYSVVDGEAPMDYAPSSYEHYVMASDIDRQIKDSVLAVWATGYGQGVLAAPVPSNLLRHTAYRDAIDSKAIVSVWLPDFTALYGFAWPELFNLDLGTAGKGFQYFGDMRIHVYADKDLRIASAIEVGERWAQPIRRMYDQKINRKFFRYINSEDVLGMYGFATNTKAILEELPLLIDNTLGSINGPYQEETALTTAIVSLLLDEAAIARALRGDGLFVLNGLDEREVPYTHYDWDEDYNLIETDSVKTEPVPDFLFMLSSNDRTIYDRMVSYMAVKGHVFNHGRIVEVSQPDMPFGIFMAHHQGILFVGSSADKLEAIVQNRYRGKITRDHRRLLKRHIASGMFSVANAAKEFDNQQLDSMESYGLVRRIFGGMGEMQYKLRMRGNVMEHEFVSRTPSDYPNAIYQIMSLIEYAQDNMY